MTFLVLTDRGQAAAPLPAVVAAAVAGGARRVVLREKDLPPGARRDLARRLRDLLAPVGGQLIAAGTDPLDGDAVHLSAADPAVPAMALVGRSCHGLAELSRLSTEDYATLSPVFPSGSKPGYGPPLGLATLAALCSCAPKPVVALGGVDTPDRATACLAAGAAGVAVMGAVMRAPDPAAVVRSFLREVPA